MLTLINGGTNSDREDVFVRRIKDAAEQGKDVLVIVPDQFSFEYDRTLYDYLGAKLFNGIKTAGFNRLAQMISDKYGESAGENADENAKTILMYKAVSRFSAGEVRFYKKSLNKGSFISQMNNLLSKLRESGVTPEQLLLTAENISGTLAMKLLDISQIYKLYLEELENSGLKDSVTMMSKSVGSADKNRFFADMEVFICAFTDFSYDELRMLDVCMKQAENITVSLLIDDAAVSSFRNHPFANVVRTRSDICSAAKAHGLKTESILCTDYSYNAKDIEFFGRKLFNLSCEEFVGAAENVKVLSAADIYEESEYICAEICRLVREENYDYRDIVVFVRDISSCAPIFRGVFERYDIPYYIDSESSVAQSPMAVYFDAVFKAVLTKEYKTENILKLVKSPLFASLDYDVNDLEEYCFKWSVEGDMWKSDFTAGRAVGGEEEDSRINALRKSVIEPLEKFKNACVNGTAKSVCAALYELLRDFKLSEQTYSAVKRAAKYDEDQQLELSRNLKQLWNLTLSAIKSIYDILGDEEISLRKFFDLFSLMMSKTTLSNPPQKLNCVRIADAGRSRVDSAKAVFAAEVNDGIFPANVGDSGLITDNESDLLKNLPAEFRVEIFSDVMRGFVNEKLIAYSVLSLPTDRLYMTYSLSDLTGREKRPSYLIREAGEILGVLPQQVHKLDLSFFCTSFDTAYYKYLEHSADKTAQTAAVRRALEKNLEYSDRIDYLLSVREQGEFSVAPELAEQLFFHDEFTYLSPSKLESYFKCPFSFFCSYGLKLRAPDRIDFSPVNKGLITHDLLEKIMSVSKSDPREENVYDGNFILLDDEQIKKRISEIFSEYYERELGGDFGKTDEFKFVYKELEKTSFNIVKFVQSALKNCRFQPKLIEYKIEQTDKDNRLVIELENNKKIVIVGKIDRADVFTDDESGISYVRIIDYKTGIKKMNLGELYNGLNLQMFVYLSALLETKNPINTDKALEQAGIVYYTFGRKTTFVDETADDDDVLDEQEAAKRLKRLKPDGNVVKKESIIDAFATDGDYSAVPFTKSSLSKKEGSDQVMFEDDFDRLRRFAMKKAKECGDRLSRGEFNAHPIEGKCAYCDYSRICGVSEPEDAIKAGSEEYRKLLEEELENV